MRSGLHAEEFAKSNKTKQYSGADGNFDYLYTLRIIGGYPESYTMSEVYQKVLISLDNSKHLAVIIYNHCIVYEIFLTKKEGKSRISILGPSDLLDPKQPARPFRADTKNNIGYGGGSATVWIELRANKRSHPVGRRTDVPFLSPSNCFHFVGN